MSTESKDSSDSSESVGASTVPKKRRLAKTLPTDRISFQKQQGIIGAYIAAYEKCGKQPVSNEDIGKLVNMAAATVSQANAFLADVGLIQKTEGGKYLPADILFEYDRVRSYSPEKAWFKLGPLFRASWFGQELISLLRVRSVSEEEALHALADVASAEADHKSQLKTAIEYLCLVGLVRRDGNTLVLGPQINGDSTAETPSQHPTAAQPPHGLPPPAAGMDTYTLTLDPKGGRKFIIQTPPTVTAKELKRIREWLGFQLIVEGAEEGK